jgi:hypothetical protein
MVAPADDAGARSALARVDRPAIATLGACVQGGCPRGRRGQFKQMPRRLATRDRGGAVGSAEWFALLGEAGRRRAFVGAHLAIEREHRNRFSRGVIQLVQ